MSPHRSRKPSPPPANGRAAAAPGEAALRAGLAAALAIATVIVYAKVSGFPYIESYDDSLYVTANPHVTSGLTPAAIAWAFSGVCAGNWHPLTMLSHMLDVTLFGAVPGPAHVVNLALHALNTVLLFLGLASLTKRTWPAALVAGLFALHPLHVESVAWIAERKDVLSTLFLLLTLGAYARWARGGGRGAFAVALACFALGLMAKPMLVTLPFALVLFDAWPLGRLEGFATPVRGVKTVSPVASLVEKWPFLLLAAGSAGATLWAQRVAGADTGTRLLPLSLRLGHALVAWATYPVKLFAPVNLACLYPYATKLAPAAVAGAALALAAVTAVVLVLRARAPWAAAGWLWYAGTLVPVIGIVQVGSQSMADRYTYVPFIGLVTALVWAAAEGFAALRVPRAAQVAAGVALLGACAWGTSRQLEYWRDPLELFRRAAAVTQGNFIAHNNCGVELTNRGRADEARIEFEKAVAADPVYVDGLDNLGIVARTSGHLDESVSALERGLAITPGSAKMHYNLAVTLAMLSRYPEAFGHFETALKLAPGAAEGLYSYSRALGNYGVALASSGRKAEAAQAFEKALALDPRNQAAKENLAIARGGAAR